jgi:DNA-binding winged helix-turn-helix (wHTH) protein
VPRNATNDGLERPTFQLGEWTVEPVLDRISRCGETVQLRPRVMDLLLCLVDAPETVISKQQLIDRVWSTEFVTENALTHAITELRTKLGDDAKNPSYIETIPRRGYRIVAELGIERPASGLASSLPVRFTLEAEDGNAFRLRDGDNLIGRSPDAGILIDSSEVSRRHARIRVHGRVAVIEDLDSKNGTFLRGRRLEAPTELQDADEIQIGVSVAKFRFRVIDERTQTERQVNC